MNAPVTSGYSGTPLAKKLGIRQGSRVMLVDAPPELASLLAPLPDGVVFESSAGPGIDIAHIFVTQQQELARLLDMLRAQLKPDAAVWVSWPKKAAKVATTVSEDSIRAAALPM